MQIVLAKTDLSKLLPKGQKYYITHGYHVNGIAVRFMEHILVT